MHPIGTLTLLATLILPLAGAQAQDTWKLGVVISQSGPQARYAAQQQAGFKVALDELNAAGGIRGRKLELVIQDDASDPAQAAAAAEALITQGVPLVIGPQGGATARALSDYLATKQVPLLIPGAVEETVTKPGNAYTFRISSPGSQNTASLMEHLGRVGKLKTAVLLTSNDAYGRNVQTDVQRLLKASGLTLLAQDTYDQGLTDFRPLLQRYKTLNPDVVLLSAFEEDAPTLVKQAREVKLQPRVLAGLGPSFATPDFLKAAGPAAENIVVPVNWNADVKYSGAALLYHHLQVALNGQAPSVLAAQSYAAVLTAADALKRGGTDPAKMRDALLKTKLSTPLGRISFQNYGGFQNQNNVLGLIVQAQGGKFFTVGPTSVARNRMTMPWR